MFLRNVTFTTVLFVTVLFACAAPQDDVYRATIRRTSYGIPHIVATDLASVAF